jgi:hypothetical protein
MRAEDLAGNGPGRYCSPCHRMLPSNSINEGTKCVSMTRPGKHLPALTQRSIAHVAGEGVCRTLFSHAGVTTAHLKANGGTLEAGPDIIIHSSRQFKLIVPETT